MKNLITIVIILISGNLFSQIAIGKDTPDADAILSFGDAGDRGLVLPYVESAAITSIAVPGTWYFDANESKVKFIGDGVKDMSVKEFKDVTKKFDKTQSFYANYYEGVLATAQGTVIGDANTGAAGALVLDTTSKALALPVTTDYKLIGDPAHGMVVYDSTIERVCVFDGEKWAFWGRY